MTTPFVSVIIVNYNGAHFLTNCLNSLRAQSYPENCFEVIVSDNGSTDDSLNLLQTQYSWVKVIVNQRNLGFASGNNVAIKRAQGQYLVLLNNDTAPTASWLESLVTLAENNPKAGIITGHLQLFYDQLELVIESETVTPINDGRTLGIQVFEVDTGAKRGVVQYLDGFYGREYFGGEYFRWTKGRAIIGVPLPHDTNLQSIQFRLAASRPTNTPVHAQVLLGDEVLTGWELLGSSPTIYTIDVPESKRGLATPLVQNAGSVIFSSGAGRDRGTFVRGNEVFYETDYHQYDCVEEVFAACGANMLIRRALLDDVGLFDDDFFMYYEDTEYGFRARMQTRYRTVYYPHYEIVHYHGKSSNDLKATLRSFRSAVYYFSKIKGRGRISFFVGACKASWRFNLAVLSMIGLFLRSNKVADKVDTFKQLLSSARLLGKGKVESDYAEAEKIPATGCKSS